MSNRITLFTAISCMFRLVTQPAVCRLRVNIETKTVMYASQDFNLLRELRIV
jgi:hypothetical protein